MRPLVMRAAVLVLVSCLGLGSLGAGSLAPSITPGGIVPVDSNVGAIQPGEWVSIYGSNLAGSTVSWNGDFPSSLGGTSVAINGKPAYLWFVSPTQLNVQAPDDATAGPVSVVVTTANGTATSTVTLAPFGPSFLLFAGKHVAGVILRSNGSGAYGGGSYDLLGPTGSSLGYPTVAAAPGDVIELFAVGLGPTSPAVPAGRAFSGAAPASNPVNILINDNYVSVTPSFAGLSGAGLFQINLTVPAGLGAGDFSLVATVGGVQTPAAVISLQDAPAGPGAPCANVGGTWNASESGTYTETIAGAGGTDPLTQTNPINGAGSTTITQTGCSIQYNPIGETGLISQNLTPSQLASLTRTGTVSGNNVSVTGLLALINTVASAQAGFTVTSVSGNVLNATGRVAGNPPVMTLTETGTLVASGTLSAGGQSSSITDTITVSSTATFARGGIITTVAGNGLGYCGSGSAGGSACSFSGDGGPATAAELYKAFGVAVDISGNIFIADSGNNRIRKVSAASGIIETVAGNGSPGFSGDGGPATAASLNSPRDVAIDAAGNLFIADTVNYRIRKVSATSGMIETVAGTGSLGFSGDGGPATAAELNTPNGIAVDPSGNLFIADTYNNRVRKVSVGGIIATVAGNGPSCGVTPSVFCGGFSGDGGPAASAALFWPAGVASDGAGNLFIVDMFNERIRKVSAASGIISTIAGSGPSYSTSYIGGFSGDGGPATSATLYDPGSVVVDVAGNVFIADNQNSRIREVSAADGTISTLTSALSLPYRLALDDHGNLFVSDAAGGTASNHIHEISLVAAPAQAPVLQPSE